MARAAEVLAPPTTDAAMAYAVAIGGSALLRFLTAAPAPLRPVFLSPHAPPPGVRGSGGGGSRWRVSRAANGGGCVAGSYRRSPPVAKLCA